MTENPLRELARLGQSIWYDNIQRSMLVDGTLQRLILEDAITGMTSNPSIFMKSIRDGQEYQQDIERLADEGFTAEQIYEALAVKDIQDAADILRPVFTASAGKDGYVSLEVSPLLANDSARTVSEALRIAGLVNRPNLMVKVPATPAGVAAISPLIAAGININATLLFAVEAYDQVMDAYLAGLEARPSGSLSEGSASVASFFISRVDTLIDKKLLAKIESTKDDKQRESLRTLLGLAGIANAQRAFDHYRKVFSSPRFLELAERGARKQKALWASTSTKNPAYRDVVYIEELIAPETVNTVPPVALEAFRDHGIPRLSLLEERSADAVFMELERVGISMQEVTEQLLQEGVELFVQAYLELLAVIEQRMKEKTHSK